MANLNILRTYAQKSNLASLPSSVLLTHTERTLTIFDAYPKSIFHFLVLPRTKDSPLTVFDLASLRTLLKSDKVKAQKVLAGLSEDAETVKTMIEEEMMKRYGFKWTVNMGFHPVPSMEHLHLHVISDDLCSPSMKNKKHYNSFHPKLGFFLHLSEVLSWFDSEASYFQTMSELKKSQYEPLLKEELACWRCGQAMKNIPTLKTHLQKEFDDETARSKASLEKKRKREAATDEREVSKKQAKDNDHDGNPSSLQAD